jgi:hypothetical protein
MPAVKNLDVFQNNSDDFETISDLTDVDDFVAPVTQSGKKVAASKRKGGATMKKDPPVKSQNILSNQRAPKKSKRLAGPVEALRPPGLFWYLCCA